MASCEGCYQPDSDGIPIDLFVSKKNPRHRIITSSGFSLRFTDSSANLVFSVDPPSIRGSPAPPTFIKRLLTDASGNLLISIAHKQKAMWQGFREDSSEEKDVIFRVERTIKTLTRLEFQVFLPNNKSDLKMRGSPFYRSCTIYNGDSVLAQTSLMYKLGLQKKLLVPRNRFRLTIFPDGYAHRALIVALTAIFFHGRKLWI
ncbi:protein LURP-one-related 7 [Cynara cardunculus var. scolymus]|uniref:protein LURP-one-related 7 n=1 Tax=Cynara cardunculus var. scolymus TaxID=59895 RepID=UPI000D630AF3|nr:protein LURP-one-related 7 [Cynara cardunculus var. scolymus]